MRISIDGGALCGARFGNYIFTENLIKAFGKYDQKNHYDIYSFCHSPTSKNLPENLRYLELYPKKFWMKIRVSLEEAKNKNDIFYNFSHNCFQLLTLKSIYYTKIF